MPGGRSLNYNMIRIYVIFYVDFPYAKTFSAPYLTRFHLFFLPFLQIGRRLRDSCRNLRVKSGSAAASGNGKCNPEDYSSVKAPPVSTVI